jgi:Flp pilus assembly protein TadD
MVVNPVDADPRWAYRRAAVDRILNAIRALLLDRAGLALRRRLEAARARYEDGDVRTCAALCEEALRHGPPEAALLHLLGLARCGLGMGELGLDMLRKASALAPDDAVLRLDLERAVSEISAARHSPAPDEGL